MMQRLGLSTSIDRRSFLKSTVAAGAAITALGAVTGPVLGANEKIVIGVMGMGGRGTDLARSFQQQDGAQVKYVCDPDAKRAGDAAAAVERVGGEKPEAIPDFRRMLDDKDIDVIVIATPNHWHAPAAILACAAGKHVYVEKPCSHNPREGELMVEAARKHKRTVQMGNQRRSWPKIMEAVELVRDGLIGRVYYSRAWYSNTRPSIGVGKEMQPPADFDFNLWQGPAPRKPFRSNYLHYNWHWFWHWGNGEIGNNGIHAIDLSRWGLDVTYPIRVTSVGGKYHWREDDQETPDTHLVGYDFEGGKSIAWEGLSGNRRGPEGNGFGVTFHGEKGTVALDSSGYTHYSATNIEQKREPGTGGNAEHIANFLACIRSGDRPHSDIEGAHQSTLLCHLGNIAHRAQRTLRCDPANGHILDDADAMTLWSREYEPGWEPKV